MRRLNLRAPLCAIIPSCPSMWIRVHPLCLMEFLFFSRASSHRVAESSRMLADLLRGDDLRRNKLQERHAGRRQNHWGVYLLLCCLSDIKRSSQFEIVLARSVTAHNILEILLYLKPTLVSTVPNTARVQLLRPGLQRRGHHRGLHRHHPRGRLRRQGLGRPAASPALCWST